MEMSRVKRIPTNMEQQKLAGQRALVFFFALGTGFVKQIVSYESVHNFTTWVSLVSPRSRKFMTPLKWKDEVKS